MNVFSFKEARRISWDGAHAGEAEAFLFASCADTDLAKQMVAIAGRGEAVVHEFDKPTFVVVDCGSHKLADEVRALIFVPKADGVAEAESALAALHEEHFMRDNGRLHWMKSATTEEVAAHHAHRAAVEKGEATNHPPVPKAIQKHRDRINKLHAKHIESTRPAGQSPVSA